MGKNIHMNANRVTNLANNQIKYSNKKIVYGEHVCVRVFAHKHTHMVCMAFLKNALSSKACRGKRLKNSKHHRNVCEIILIAVHIEDEYKHDHDHDHDRDRDHDNIWISMDIRKVCILFGTVCLHFGIYIHMCAYGAWSSPLLTSCFFVTRLFNTHLYFISIDFNHLIFTLFQVYVSVKFATLRA